MSDVFGSGYADVYDDLYRDKDYGVECESIERLLQSYGTGPIRNLLDLGCGTGNHALPLAQRGYSVVGVDRSESMLRAARQKATAQSVAGAAGGATFYEGDIRSLQLAHAFDASLIMFAVLGYQLENADVLAALRTARKHVRPDGLLIFDVWYGPAVLRQAPSDRVKTVATDGGQILRVASGQLDVQRHLCQVTYRLWRMEGDRVTGHTEETHQMRYFFPLELNLFLESSGFSPIRLGAFDNFDRDPDETTWNVLGIARAV